MKGVLEKVEKRGEVYPLKKSPRVFIFGAAQSARVAKSAIVMKAVFIALFLVATQKTFAGGKKK